jgi:hypothetical protein
MRTRDSDQWLSPTWSTCSSLRRVSHADCRISGFSPNKSLQPTATAVTPPAAQEIVTAVAVADHKTFGFF